VSAEFRILEEILHELRAIRREIAPRPTPTEASFKEMSMLPADPGNTLVFAIVLSPAGSAIPAGTVSTITSSDPTVVPTLDPTGLIVTVPLPTGITVGESVTLTWDSGTFTPSPVNAPSSIGCSTTITIGAPPPPPTPTPVSAAFVQTQ